MVYFLQEYGDIIGKRSARSTPDHANVKETWIFGSFLPRGKQDQ